MAFPSLTDLISFWPLDEPSGPRSDVHGTNHLTDNGLVAGIAGHVYATAADINGTGKYLYCASNAGLQLGNVDFTFGVWLSPDDVASTMTFMVKGDTLNDIACYLQYHITGGLGFTAMTGSGWAGQTSAVAGALAVGQWYFLVYGHDAANNQLFLQVNNGTYITAPFSSAGVYSETARLVWGASSIYSGSDCRLGPAFFYKRLLTPAERTALYNGGAGLQFPGGAAFSTGRVLGSNVLLQPGVR